MSVLYEDENYKELFSIMPAFILIHRTFLILFFYGWHQLDVLSLLCGVSASSRAIRNFSFVVFFFYSNVFRLLPPPLKVQAVFLPPSGTSLSYSQVYR